MPSEKFHSFAQNGEDVVLWRALGRVEKGRYIDVGANHPTVDSVTRAFYDHGWRGILVEPVPEYAALLREQRPEDEVIEAAAVAGEPGTATLHEMPGTGLSTLVDAYRDQHVESGRVSRELTVATLSLDDVLTKAGWEDEDIHFMSVDTEGAEETVLASLDLRRWRPWVLMIESTAPNTAKPTYQAWEQIVLTADYEFVLFDGLSRFYVAREHADELRPLLAYPAMPLDAYSTLAERDSEAQRAGLESQLADRTAQLDELRVAHHELSQLHHELNTEAEQLRSELESSRARSTALAERLGSVEQSSSWRLTRPFRAIKAAAQRRTGRS